MDFDHAPKAKEANLVIKQKKVSIVKRPAGTSFTTRARIFDEAQTERAFRRRLPCDSD
jgi:hypothetical protein